MSDKSNLPKHIAFIVDGNGRWAKERGLPRSEGHRRGISRLREIVKESLELGVKVVTFFVFSAENWQRPKEEIDTLMGFLSDFLGREADDLHKKGIRFMAIGRGDPLPEDLQSKIKLVAKKTQDNTAMTIVLAVNYGARQEIIDGIKKFADLAAAGKVNIDDLNEDGFKRYLYTADLPDPDLLVRTSGEMRISNFLLWQLSYAELYFPKEYWPDFGRDGLLKAIEIYQGRERRFGRVG